MAAQLASAVSDETSPTRRESPVQSKQRLAIAFVRRTDGFQILASDRTFPADHLFRPFRDGAPISFEPDVREHPRPTAVAVEEGVDLDREMMEALSGAPGTDYGGRRRRGREDRMPRSVRQAARTSPAQRRADAACRLVAS